MLFPDLSEYLPDAAGDPIVLPIRGHAYTFPPTVSLALGLELRRVRAAFADPNRKPGDVLIDDEAAFYARLIGEEMLDRMQADGVRFDEYQRVGNTLMCAYLFGVKVAQVMWTGLADQLAADSKSAAEVADALSASTVPDNPPTKPSKSAAGTPRRREVPPPVVTTG